MCLYYFWFFFFFKQKTAYEMRISDWSSDVCSSDLLQGEGDKPGRSNSSVAHLPALQHPVSRPCAIVPLLFQRFISGEEIHARAEGFVAGTGLRGRRDRLRDLFGPVAQPAAGGHRKIGRAARGERGDQDGSPRAVGESINKRA